LRSENPHARSGHQESRTPRRARLSSLIIETEKTKPKSVGKELCTPANQVAERKHLRSASRRLLVVPRMQLDTYEAFVLLPSLVRGLEFAGQRSARPRSQHKQLWSPDVPVDAFVSAVFSVLSALDSKCAMTR